MAKESVQAQATRRGQELDVLATVYDAVLAMRDCIAETTRVLEVTTGKIEAQDAQLAEQGDAILALSNRIETLTRTATAHHGQLANLLGHSPLEGLS